MDEEAYEWFGEGPAVSAGAEEGRMDEACAAEELDDL